MLGDTVLRVSHDLKIRQTKLTRTFRQIWHSYTKSILAVVHAQARIMQKVLEATLSIKRLIILS